MGATLAAIPLQFFSERDVGRIGKRDGERNVKNQESGSIILNHMSNVFDGNTVGTYLDWRSNIFGQVMSKSY